MDIFDPEPTPGTSAGLLASLMPPPSAPDLGAAAAPPPPFPAPTTESPMGGAEGSPIAKEETPKPPPASPLQDGVSGGAAKEENSDEERGETAGAALSDLLLHLDQYPPSIPDAITAQILQQAGFETTSPQLSRLLALAAQKFVSDVANEAFTHNKLKGQANPPHPNQKGKPKDKKYTLTMEDLGPVLSEHGITVKKPPYYT